MRFASPEATDRALQDAVASAHVKEFTDRFEDGLATVIGERGVKLSGGSASGWPSPGLSSPTPGSSSWTRRPRVSIPRASRSSRRAWRVLMKGRTTFVIAHRLSTIRKREPDPGGGEGRDRRAGHPRGAAERRRAATTPCTPGSTGWSTNLFLAPGRRRGGLVRGPGTTRTSGPRRRRRTSWGCSGNERVALPGRPGPRASHRGRQPPVPAAVHGARAPRSPWGRWRWRGSSSPAAQASSPCCGATPTRRSSACSSRTATRRPWPRPRGWPRHRGARFVDLNCGCPIHEITRRGLGASLLRKPAKLGRLVEAMKKAVSVPVTVKLRSGWKEAQGERLRGGPGLRGERGRRPSPCTRARASSATTAPPTGT